MANDCSCEVCKIACERKPGWFMPGEVEKVAEFQGISLRDLFETKLGVDYWQSEPDIFVLAPATITMQPGGEYPSNPKGQCIFYQKGQCSIHPVKPFECREYYHGDNLEEANKRHRNIADAWIGHQGQIEDLLGYEPEAEYPGFFDFMTW